MLFIKKYPSGLKDDFLNEIASLPVHSMISIDIVPVPKEMTTKILQRKYMGIESEIIRQQRVRNRNNDFSKLLDAINNGKSIAEFPQKNNFTFTIFCDILIKDCKYTI